jgi:hypothetical protein
VQEDLERAGIAARALEPVVWWSYLRSAPSTPLLVQDPLCPLSPRELVESVASLVRGSDTSYVAVRPVTDTVKTAAGGRITGTIDRTGLRVVSSPAAIAGCVMERALAEDDEPPLRDVALLVAWLHARGAVETLTAPSLARRIDDATSVDLLECVHDLHHQLRQARGGS